MVSGKDVKSLNCDFRCAPAHHVIAKDLKKLSALWK